MKAVELAVASTKRLGCSVHLAAPLFVTLNWPVNALNATLFSPVERKAHHLKAASLALLLANTALDSSPNDVQPLPSGPAGTGTAETLSPSA